LNLHSLICGKRSCKCNSLITAGLILTKLYTVAVHHLRMWIIENNHGPAHFMVFQEVYFCGQSSQWIPGITSNFYLHTFKFVDQMTYLSTKHVMLKKKDVNYIS